MTFARINNCPIYKEGQIIEVSRYLYDKNLNKTNRLFEESTLKDIVADCHIKTIHGHYILLPNSRPLVTVEELRYVKLKRILNGIS